MSNSTVPAYLVLVSQLLEVCDALGVQPIRASSLSTLPENKGYVFLRFGSDDAAAVIVPKSAAQVKLCDIHVDCSDVAGWVPLRKENGRVMGHIDAATADWQKIVERLFGASKRPVQRASRGASQQPAGDMAALLAKLQTLGQPKAQPAASEPAPAADPVPAEIDSDDDLSDGTYSTTAEA